ncbi:GNAT family N-acetyltransferase [Pseudonocardia spinosispora]|uniref:GNAT family N-acetyltransferase n=1 Tax=Pseudonocardia spinosispora TaxID=103441 RepID=UPI000401686B|nr:GNAT family N-acetyltransferase [Pseudonocardia spinosispora]
MAPIVLDYQVSVEATGSAARAVWNELAADHPDAPLSRTPRWIDCICDCDSFTDETLLFRGGDGRRIVFPRLGVPRVPGVFASPSRHWNIGADAHGFLAEGGPLSRAETAALVRAVHRNSGMRTRIVVGGDDVADWDPAVPDGTYYTARTAQTLDLTGGFSTVWADRFTGKVRSHSRKAHRRGVTVESDTTGRLVPVFYQLYRSSVDRWARARNYPLPLMRFLSHRQHPMSKFEKVARNLGEQCTVWIARLHGEPIAGLIVLSGGRRATYWRGAMDKDLARGTGANEILHRHAIEAACESGGRSYDFGLSQTDDLRRFKASFGAVEVPIRTYYFEKVRTAKAGSAGYDRTKRVIIAGVRLARSVR